MMLQYKTYHLSIYPDMDQEVLILKTFGCTRFIHNHFLELWNEECLKTGKGLSYEACSDMLAKMKDMEATCWLKDVDSMALQSTLEALMDSFFCFYRNNGQYPQFKSKRSAVQSYTTKNLNHSITLTESHLKLPRMGLVSHVKGQEIKGRILYATIRRDARGEFSVSILCEEDVQDLPEAGLPIGTHRWIAPHIILSDASRNDNPQIMTKMEKKLKREQRKLSRRASGAMEIGKDLSEAKNYQKQRLKVEKLQRKVSNPKNDVLNRVDT